MRTIELVDLPTSSAEDLRTMYRNDPYLPDRKDLERMELNPSLIPVEFRCFDLVFPKAIYPGLFEGGCKVTDEEIGTLVWDGKKWKVIVLLAGKDGWGCSGPDHCGPRGRLVRFKN